MHLKNTKTTVMHTKTEQNEYAYGIILKQYHVIDFFSPLSLSLPQFKLLYLSWCGE